MFQYLFNTRQQICQKLTQHRVRTLLSTQMISFVKLLTRYFLNTPNSTHLLRNRLIISDHPCMTALSPYQHVGELLMSIG